MVFRFFNANVLPYNKCECEESDIFMMDYEYDGEVVHEGWLTKSPPLENKTRQLFTQTLIQPVSVHLINYLSRTRPEQKYFVFCKC